MKRLLLAVAGLAALPVCAAVAIQLYAEARASAVMARFAAHDPDETILNVARWAANEFPAYTGKTIATYRRQLAYSGYFPRRIWPTVEAVDFLAGQGHCNHLVSALSLIMSPQGFDISQHDIVTETNGHSAVSVRYGDRLVYIDPFYGWVFAEDGRLIDFDRLRWLAASGHDPGQYAIPLRAEPGSWLYDDLPHTYDAFSGAPMAIKVRLPIENGHFRIGHRDDSSRDVVAEGGNYHTTTHLYYLGPKLFGDLSLDIVRRDRPGGSFDLTFHLLEPIDPEDLPASNVAPEIDGTTVTYRVASKLRLDYSGMGRWYGVDMVEASALPTHHATPE